MGISDDIRIGVKARLAELGWTQAELSRRSGVHPVALARWLGNRPSRNSIGPASLDKIFSALGVKADVTPVSRKG